MALVGAVSCWLQAFSDHSVNGLKAPFNLRYIERFSFDLHCLGPSARDQERQFDVVFYWLSGSQIDSIVAAHLFWLAAALRMA
ncbi:hypothetical protein A7J42_22375 [Brucella intermedia]|nr:hypothetical protein A7J42_22375 [Brucella intermedia]